MALDRSTHVDFLVKQPQEVQESSCGEGGRSERKIPSYLNCMANAASGRGLQNRPQRAAFRARRSRCATEPRCAPRYCPGRNVAFNCDECTCPVIPQKQNKIALNAGTQGSQRLRSRASPLCSSKPPARYQETLPTHAPNDECCGFLLILNKVTVRNDPSTKLPCKEADSEDIGVWQGGKSRG